ncbi:hypothetical protein KUTeg_006049 [Tegillarca granosa]|uniref:Ig-like domain-containing protein n=1 Tax=Tegillarca granosa TaxID=220873 RepID=A0ABQ9FK34_TEGGR|nr:hypothetical protein KUTeg_006049 [Tegillarca granosa]
MAGERTEFDCTVGYVGKKPPDVNWLMGNMPVNATDLQVKKNIIKATLGIKTSAGMNGHTYHCQISYAGIFSILCPTHSPLLLNRTVFTNFTQSSVLDPVQDVKIFVYPSIPHRKKYLYPRGTKIKLYCNGNGNPQPKFYWTFSPADGSGFRNLNDDHHYIITNASLSDQGNYTCTAISVIKNTKSSPVIINKYGYEHISHNTDSKISGSDKKDGKNSNKENSSDISISPYAIGAIVTAALAILLIVVFIMLVLKFKARDRRMRQQFSRIHDENLDDQEVELLDENIQPVVSNSDPVSIDDKKRGKKFKVFPEPRCCDTFLGCQILKTTLHKSSVMKMDIMSNMIEKSL